MSTRQQTHKGNVFRNDPQPKHGGESSELGWFDWIVGWFSQEGNSKVGGDLGTRFGSSSIKNYPPDTRGK